MMKGVGKCEKLIFANAKAKPKLSYNPFNISIIIWREKY